MEKFICRPDKSHWCAECCDGRNCERYGELPDGTWGCLTHPDKPEICKQVNCLTEMRISFREAQKKISALSKGEFYASALTGKPQKSGEI